MIVKATELSGQVPYLDLSRVGDRVVNLMPLWDGRSWKHWVPGPGGILEVEPIDVVESDYVAKEAACEHDLLIPFVELMWQRMTFPEVCPLIGAICDDFHNLGTTVAKLRHFHRTRDLLPESDLGRFAATELEYLLVLSRTIFDLLQEVVSELFSERVRWADSGCEAKRKARKLPTKFSKVVLREKKDYRSVDEIHDCFGLPEIVARAYAERAMFFSNLRDSRDAVVHHGRSVGTVFATPRGFCIDPKEAPFSRYKCWKGDHYYNEHVASVLPWIAEIVLGTIDACNAIMYAIASVVIFPPDIAPGYRVFVRGPSTPALVEVLRVSSGGSPWWDESDDGTLDQPPRLRRRAVSEPAGGLVADDV
ncbi:MAG: hypothetical protein HY043_07375 [Verrucomicrobia bacterium]|nr:hypothetical protein [Verrucomicrobiota bacterium]